MKKVIYLLILIFFISLFINGQTLNYDKLNYNMFNKIVLSNSKYFQEFFKLEIYSINFDNTKEKILDFQTKRNFVNKELLLYIPFGIEKIKIIITVDNTIYSNNEINNFHIPKSKIISTIDSKTNIYDIIKINSSDNMIQYLESYLNVIIKKNFKPLSNMEKIEEKVYKYKTSYIFLTDNPEIINKYTIMQKTKFFNYLNFQQKQHNNSIKLLANTKKIDLANQKFKSIEKTRVENHKLFALYFIFLFIIPFILNSKLKIKNKKKLNFILNTLIILFAVFLLYLPINNLEYQYLSKSIFTNSNYIRLEKIKHNNKTKYIYKSNSDKDNFITINQKLLNSYNKIDVNLFNTNKIYFFKNNLTVLYNEKNQFIKNKALSFWEFNYD